MLGRIKVGEISMDVYKVELVNGQFELWASTYLLRKDVVPTGRQCFELYDKDGILMVSGVLDTTRCWEEARKNKPCNVTYHQEMPVKTIEFIT